MKIYWYEVDNGNQSGPNYIRETKFYTDPNKAKVEVIDSYKGYKNIELKQEGSTIIAIKHKTTTFRYIDGEIYTMDDTTETKYYLNSEEVN